MTDLPTWEEMVASVPTTEEDLLALDPGETTGYAIFSSGTLKDHGQVDTLTVTQSVDLLYIFISGRTHVVVENYQVYSWKLKEHKFSTLHTPRLIGCIETLCKLEGIGLSKQTAQNAKKFVTDEKLKEWGMWIKGRPHARDAIRHGIYYTIFGGKK